VASRCIEFVEPNAAACLQALGRCADSAQPAALVESESDLWRELRDAPAQGSIPCRPLPPAQAAEYSGTVLLTETRVVPLADQLLQFVDNGAVHIIAPRTARHFQSQALFLVTIPKSGTHLARSLLREFGYAEGGEHNHAPLPGHWYCLEYSNSHTRATDFFIDSVRRAPFGNRHHPFPRTPTLFLYRNPLDVLVSEAMYYHRDGNALFAGYLGGLSLEDRIMRLISDPWLLGTLRDRVAGFIPWLAFGNVMPISFEELVGPAGGGGAEQQRGVIWALQLKLQIPGRPEEFARRIYDTSAPTFVHGRIGAHREVLTSGHREALSALKQDFMTELGFDADGAAAPGPSISRRAGEFRHRPLVLAPRDAETPVLVEADRMFFNIVFYGGRYYGVPCDLGPIDIAALPEARRNLLPSHLSPHYLRAQLAFGPVHAGIVSDWYSLMIADAVRRGLTPDRVAFRHPLDAMSRLADLAERARRKWRRLFRAAK
jgi:hypothetical protein